MSRFSNVHVVINPASGQPAPVLRTLNHVFGAGDFAWNVSIMHRAGDGKAQAEEALKRGADLVVAYGGDGTIGDVANGLVGTGVPLLPLPGGTANVYGKALGIPQLLESAAKTIFTGQVKQYDVGQIGEKYFILNMDSGPAGELIDKTPPELKRRYGVFAYVIYTLTHLPAIKQAMFHIVVDGQEHEIEAVACIVANCGNVGTEYIKLDLDVSPDDGLLDVFVLPNAGTAIRSVAMQLLRLKENVEAHRWQAKSIEISTVPTHSTRIEGDAFGQTPVSIQVVPRALNVLVPKRLAL